MKHQYLVIVACINANGESDFWACYVVCNSSQFGSGKHYDVAREECVNAGYEPMLCYDENDPGWNALGNMVGATKYQEAPVFEIES